MLYQVIESVFAPILAILLIVGFIAVIAYISTYEFFDRLGVPIKRARATVVKLCCGPAIGQYQFSPVSSQYDAGWIPTNYPNMLIPNSYRAEVNFLGVTESFAIPRKDFVTLSVGEDVPITYQIGRRSGKVYMDLS